MLLEWNGTGPLIIETPKRDTKCILLPGNNEVADKDWQKLREQAVPNLKLKRLVEIHGGPKKDGDKAAVVSGKLLKQLNPEEAEAFVAGTLNLATLNSWLKGKNADARDASRVAIRNQIDFVNANGRRNEDDKK